MSAMAGGERAAQPAGHTPTVHVIDDDEAVRRALAMLLRSAGFGVETYASGPVFLDALATPGGARPGCVLTDVRMPGLDGIELLLRLREHGVRTPVVVMTAHGDVATAVRAMKAGAADFVEKPFDDEALLAALGAALDEAARPGGAAEAAARIASLSPRERQVLELLTAGKSNKQIARDLGYTVVERDIARAELYMAEEMFLSGTAAELVPVREIDDHDLGAPGEVTRQIQAKFEDALNGRAEEYL